MHEDEQTKERRERAEEDARRKTVFEDDILEQSTGVTRDTDRARVRLTEFADGTRGPYSSIDADIRALLRVDSESEAESVRMEMRRADHRWGKRLQELELRADRAVAVLRGQDPRVMPVLDADIAFLTEAAQAAPVVGLAGDPVLMRIYVAGASAEILRAEAFVKRLRDAGFEITFDWPAMIRSVGSANGGLTDDQRNDASYHALAGVDECDVLVLLVPSVASSGCWLETGYAFGSQRDIIYVGDPERTIFSALTRHVVATDDQAFDLLVEWKAAA